MYYLWKPLLLWLFFHLQWQNLILTNMVDEMLQRKLDLYQDSLCWKIVSKPKLELRTFNFADSIFLVSLEAIWDFFVVVVRGNFTVCIFPWIKKFKNRHLTVLLRYNWYTKKFIFNTCILLILVIIKSLLKSLLRIHHLQRFPFTPWVFCLFVLW